eukprot:TRINITY_DN1933_c1_g2_i1.p1 TRINITY_DN1933_c1_g2~~TRINITY_DN1933_c1_g2_i1.p1  ORF type:complete len:314 (+),score=65.15 TRINITY_DN1933_c1_g2_i1:669-1610(+)
MSRTPVNMKKSSVFVVSKTVTDKTQTSPLTSQVRIQPAQHLQSQNFFQILATQQKLDLSCLNLQEGQCSVQSQSILFTKDISTTQQFIILRLQQGRVVGMIGILDNTFPPGTLVKITQSKGFDSKTDRLNRDNQDDCHETRVKNDSASVDIEAFSKKGEKIQPAKPIQINLVLAFQTTKGVCIHSTPSSSQKGREWTCETTKIENEQGNHFATSNVTHLTSFAALLEVGNGNSCDNNRENFWWIASLVALVVALVCVVVIILVMVFVDEPHFQSFILGESYERRKFNKQMTNDAASKRRYRQSTSVETKEFRK